MEVIRRKVKDGFMEYERAKRNKVFDTTIQVKIESEKKEKLIELSKLKGYNSYSKLIKQNIDEMLKENNLL